MAIKRKFTAPTEADHGFDVSEAQTPQAEPAIRSKPERSICPQPAPITASKADDLPSTFGELLPILTALDNIANPTPADRARLAEVRRRVFSLQNGAPAPVKDANAFAALKQSRESAEADRLARIAALKAARL